MNVDSWITVTLLLTVTALVLQIGSYAAPMWIWWKSGTVYSGIGLWYVVGCSGSSCGVGGGTAFGAGTLVSGPFLALQIMQSVGLAGVLALTVFFTVYKIGYSSRWGALKNLNLGAAILNLCTIVVLLASAGVFIGYFRFAFTFPGVGYEANSIPWSAVMSWVSIVLLIIICVFTRMCCRPDAYEGVVIPMSGDTKMELNPHVQNGMVNRYYNQTPYNDDRIRYVEDYRRGGGYDDRYDNRAYIQDPEPAVIYGKPTARDFRDNRDRELGHTIYTGSGVPYVKAQASRPERDPRYARPVVLADYGNRRGPYDDYYERDLRGSRVVTPVSNSYIYRPHQY